MEKISLLEIVEGMKKGVNALVLQSFIALWVLRRELPRGCTQNCS
jgi:hypothetical protein